MLIGGQWRNASSGETLPSIDPATGKVLSHFPSGTALDADEAMRAAGHAFPAWKKITPYDRGRLLQKTASLIEQHGDELAELITLENGKPLWEAKKEVSKAQQQRVLGYIDIGSAENAHALSGGKAPGGALADGFFVEPTVFGDVNNQMRIAREEIFGPVVCAIPFVDLPDAIAKGNDSPFGLAAGVWTRDIRIAHQAAAALDAGTVWVNCYNTFDNASPWGGFKQSGWGREKGPYGLDLFAQIKSVIINFT